MIDLQLYSSPSLTLGVGRVTHDMDSAAVIPPRKRPTADAPTKSAEALEVLAAYERGDHVPRTSLVTLAFVTGEAFTFTLDELSCGLAQAPNALARAAISQLLELLPPPPEVYGARHQLATLQACTATADVSDPASHQVVQDLLGRFTKLLRRAPSTTPGAHSVGTDSPDACSSTATPTAGTPMFMPTRGGQSVHNTVDSPQPSAPARRHKPAPCDAAPVGCNVTLQLEQPYAKATELLLGAIRGRDVVPLLRWTYPAEVRQMFTALLWRWEFRLDAIRVLLTPRHLRPRLIDALVRESLTDATETWSDPEMKRHRTEEGALKRAGLAFPVFAGAHVHAAAVGAAVRASGGIVDCPLHGISSRFVVSQISGFVSSGRHAWTFQCGVCEYVGIGVISRAVTRCDTDFSSTDGCAVRFMDGTLHTNYGAHAVQDELVNFSTRSTVTLTIDCDNRFLLWCVDGGADEIVSFDVTELAPAVVLKYNSSVEWYRNDISQFNC
jgi:hypothetical protein